MKPTLWILSELFYPEESSTAFILTNIALKLSEKYSVKVIAGEPVYETVKNVSELSNEIEIIRVKGSHIDKNNVLKRIKRAIFLSKHFADELDCKALPEDKVFAVTNPAFNILGISKICEKKNLNLVILVHDVFPENTISAGLLHKWDPIYYYLVKRFNKAYKCANKIITIGDDMSSVIRDKIKTKETNVISIPNWANTDSLSQQDFVNTDKIIIKFAGNIGRVQGIETILNIIKKVNNSELEFVFQGNGACKSVIQNYDGGNVIYKAAYKRFEEQSVLSEGTIGLVSLDAQMFGLGVPSKTYNLMACGRPVLFIGPAESEIYKLVNSNDIGWAFDIKNEMAIISFLDSLSIKQFEVFREKGNKARRYAEEVLSKEKILNRFLEEV